ncbi:unnamed protein product [Lepidochelys kempii]
MFSRLHPKQGTGTGHFRQVPSPSKLLSGRAVPGILDNRYVTFPISLLAAEYQTEKSGARCAGVQREQPGRGAVRCEALADGFPTHAGGGRAGWEARSGTTSERGGEPLDAGGSCAGCC